MYKKYISIALILLLVTSSIPAFAAPSSWANAGVNRLLEHKLIPLDLQSAYQKPITRGEFARLLIPAMEHILRLDQKNDYAYPITKVPFSDTKETNVMKAYSNGIIGGIGNNKFNPNGLITREQVAIMMVNAVDSLGMLSYITKTPAITDDKQISSWAKAYVYAALNNSLMNGIGKGLYAPKDSVTREQAILMVNNVIDSFLNAGSINIYRNTIDGINQNYLTYYKSLMIWSFNGRKAIKTDLASILGQNLDALASTFGPYDFEHYVKFKTFSLETGGEHINEAGEAFRYDIEAVRFMVYGLNVYHKDNIVTGFTLYNNAAFNGSISGYQTSYLYKDAIAFLGQTEKFDDGSEIVYGEVDGYHIDLVFDDLTKPSIAVTIYKLK